MAKETTPQPRLRTLIEQIQLLSDEPIKKQDIASTLRISNEYLSRLLAKEKVGGEIPGDIIAKLKTKYKHVLEPARGKLEENKVVSLLTERLLYLLAKDTANDAILNDLLAGDELERRDKLFEQDAKRRLALWKEKGIF